LAALGPEQHRLRSIEIVRPSLEAVLLSLTGRRPAAPAPAKSALR
jgi:hypothetical protein